MTLTTLPQGLDLEALAYDLARTLDRHGLKEAGWSAPTIARAQEATCEPSAINAANVAAILPCIIAHVSPLLEERDAEIEWLNALLAVMPGPLTMASWRCTMEADKERIKALEEEVARLTEGTPREVKEIITLRRMRAAGLQRLMEAPSVLIQSDNGFWRANGQGYTYAPTAAVYTGADAYERTRHCGPEKEVRYHVLKSARALLNPSTVEGKEDV